MIGYRLLLKILIILREEDDQEVFSVRFSQDGRLFAAACGDGSVQVFFVKYFVTKLGV